MVEARIKYDKESDIMYLDSNGSVKDSLELGNYVFDFSASGKIVGIEILDASIILKKLLNIPKKALTSIKKANLSPIKSRGLMYVKIEMEITVDNKVVKETLTPSIPQA